MPEGQVTFRGPPRFYNIEILLLMTFFAFTLPNCHGIWAHGCCAYLSLSRSPTFLLVAMFTMSSYVKTEKKKKKHVQQHGQCDHGQINSLFIKKNKLSARFEWLPNDRNVSFVAEGNYCTQRKFWYFLCWRVRWKWCWFVWFISSKKWQKWWIWY